MLVPESFLYCVGMGHEESTSTPGPAISTFPPLENGAILLLLSIAATAIIVGEFAGAPVLATVPGRLLSLPDAAMISEF